MKKLTLCLSLCYVLFATVTLFACQSTQEKIDVAQQKVKEVSKGLKVLNAAVKSDETKRTNAVELKILQGKNI